MKNIKLALLCLALSNICFIESMEEQEEEEYDKYYQQQMMNLDENKKEPNNPNLSFVIDDPSFSSPFFYNPESTIQNTECMNDEHEADTSSKKSFDDLLKQLAALNFSQDTENLSLSDSPSSFSQIIEEFFNSTDDLYAALNKSLEYLSSIDENWGTMYEQVNVDTPKFIYLIVKKLSMIEDIKPIFHQTMEETSNSHGKISADETIKAILICSRIDIDQFSIEKFYALFDKLNKGFRNIVEDYNDVLLPHLSNVHQSLWLPIVQLQIETGYPLVELTNLSINAFLMGNKDLIKFMIVQGVIPVDPIFNAALAGNLNYLQSTKFDINAIEPLTGLSLLGFAALGDNQEIADALIRSGADIDLGNPLHVAAFFGSLPIAKLLVQAGANVNAKSTIKYFPKYRPIDMALIGNHIEIAKFLFDHELNSGETVVDTDQHQTFECALSTKDKNMIELFLNSYPQCFSSTYLSKSPFPSNVTPLHLATQYNWIRIATLLLNAGVSLNIKTNKYGNTPLHFASDFGHYKIAKLLLEADARIEPKNHQGLAALDLARLTFVYANNKGEKINAANTYQLLYNANKEVLNECYPEDLSPYTIHVKRRLSHETLKSSSTVHNKRQKTKLTKKLLPKKEINPLKDY